MQDGAEDGESDGDWKWVDERTEGYGENVEIAHGDVDDDPPVCVGDGSDGQNDDDIEETCCSVLFGDDLLLVVGAVCVFLSECHR